MALYSRGLIIGRILTSEIYFILFYFIFFLGGGGVEGGGGLFSGGMFFFFGGGGLGGCRGAFYRNFMVTSLSPGYFDRRGSDNTK